MTSKERAALRAQANPLEVLFQVGKGGISDALIDQTDGALRTRELIKLRVLTETSPVTPREAAETLQSDYHVIRPILDGHAGSDRPFTTIEDNAAEKYPDMSDEVRAAGPHSAA